MSGTHFVHTEFMLALMRMAIYNERYVALPTDDILYHGVPFSYHVAARNELANQREGEWTFFLDTDQRFDPDVLCRLHHTMDKHTIDVVTGVYYQRGEPHLPVIYRARDDGTFQIISRFPDDRPFVVVAAGAGCLLVRNTVFDRIEAELGESPFDIRHPLSEDLSFFKRLQELKVEVWCDPRVEAEHLRIVGVTANDHARAVATLPQDEHPVVIIEVP